MAGGHRHRHKLYLRALRVVEHGPPERALRSVLRLGEHFELSGRVVLRIYRRAGGQVRTREFYRARRELRRRGG